MVIPTWTGVPHSVGPIGLLLAAAVALVGALAVAYGVGELRLARLVLRSRPDSVLDATNGGPVELRGTVEPAGGALRSPFTGTPCVAYEYTVEEERQTKNGTTWTTISSGEETVPFRLDDGSGSVLVEPPGADVRLASDDRIDVEGGTAPPAPIRRYIERTEDVDSQNRTLDLRLFELRTGADRRYVERRLDVGAEAHVLGTARHDTTVASASGQVNAAVGIDEAARSPSPWVRLRHRVLGQPFVVSDRSERRLGLRAALVGTVAVLAGVASLGVVASLVAAWLSTLAVT